MMFLIMMIKVPNIADVSFASSEWLGTFLKILVLSSFLTLEY